MKSSFQNLLLWFFPTRYFDNADDLRDWNLNYRKEYAVFSRGAALAAMIISVILYYVADIHRFKDNSGLLIAIIYRLATILLCSLVIGYSFTGHYYSSRWFKLPVLMLALVSSFFEAYVNLRLDPVTPLYYCYLIPFLGVWVCQFGPGLSVLILAFILLPISYGVVLVHGYEHFYYFNAISLTMLSISMLFLMRIEMLNKIKYFLINKKYLEETRLRLEETKLRYKETELRYKELGDLATQVAHDIRSPLSAIMILAKDNPNIPEDGRMLFRTGISRILDITNDLLSKGKAFLDSTKQDPSVGDAENNSVFLVTDVVESIVSEKRVEFRSKLGIQIVLNFQQSTFGMFAKFQKSELKRILSNLINNSVEAVKEKGRIEINAFLLNGQIHVSVQDNGCGIPEDILPKLLKRGASFNKGENNLGVGLYHANTKVTEWGGNITISSEVNKGTTITLTLPESEKPKWFAEKIEISKNLKVVILDDDLAIHQVWDRRFESYEKDLGIELIHLSTIQQFESWVKLNAGLNALYLVDYELLGQSKTGVDVISTFNIQDRAILVTGRSEEQGLIDKCVGLGIKVLPKVSADMVFVKVR